ncbi:MAG: NDP-sugar synthase [Methanomassiliicoccales archaeon]|nr:NDP-sugar synthase [Methanomassiliicoccales archaeon]
MRVVRMRGKVRQAVILAGGEGTRLRPLTDTRPKPLLPVLGMPCIEYVISSLAEAGVEHIILACGYRSQDLIRMLGDGRRLGLEMEFAFEERPMGTAGAVKLLQDRLEPTFVVGSGDTMTDADLGALIDFHYERGAEATMGLTEVGRPEQFGIVGVDAEGRIERFKEKPRSEEVFSRVINAGTYVLNRNIIDLVPEGTKFDFSKDLFPDLLRRGRGLYASPLRGYWKDIGRPEDLYLANIEMAERRGKDTPQGRVAGTAPPGVEVQGPAFFGEGIIAAGCRVVRSAVGSHCTMGRGVTLQDCLLLDGVSIGQGATLRSCVLGQGCQVEAGTVLAERVLGDGTQVRADGVTEPVRPRTSI